MTTKTKRCSKCKKPKPLSEFHRKKFVRKDGSVRHGHQTICKQCRREYQKNWYAANKSTHKRATAKQRQINCRRAREYVRQYLLVHPCTDCPETDPVVLEFDHVHGDKRSSVAKLVSSGYSTRVIQAEIDKCEVVCANCHRRRTAQRGNWHKLRLD